MLSLWLLIELCLRFWRHEKIATQLVSFVQRLFHQSPSDDIDLGITEATCLRIVLSHVYLKSGACARVKRLHELAELTTIEVAQISVVDARYHSLSCCEKCRRFRVPVVTATAFIHSAA